MTRTWVTAVAAVGLLIAMGTGAANAQVLEPIAVLGGTNASSNVFFTPGATGGLTYNNDIEFLQGKVGQGFNPNVLATFTTMANGTFTLNPDGTFQQVLNPGTTTSAFHITDNTTHQLLLAGTFGTAVLTGTVGASSGTVTLNADSVTYTGGSFFPAGFEKDNGSLSMEFLSNTPFSASPTLGLHAFSGVDGVTFSAVIPEPASYASFGIGALLLLIALLRKRRSSRLLGAS